jgi:lysophospholipase L1-like esterase
MIARVIAPVLIGGLLFSAPLPIRAESETPFLEETADRGQPYLDSLIFFGESTTAHLRARGVLTGGNETHQVWSDQSGTKMLSSKITSEPIVYPETGELLTLSEACSRKNPEILVLSFGLNGAVRFANDTDLYIRCYEKLIHAIESSSPDTKIILQTIYPVRRADAYSVDVDTLNSYLMQLNGMLPTLAARHANLRIVDTASVLRDETGRLHADYAEADGIHLNVAAYAAILSYLRTHAW